jgi:hypothetical protein
MQDQLDRQAWQAWQARQALQALRDRLAKLARREQSALKALKACRVQSAPRDLKVHRDQLALAQQAQLALQACSPHLPNLLTTLQRRLAALPATDSTTPRGL